MSTIKPIFLLADSQLLFWRAEDGPFLARARALIDADADGGEAAARDGRGPRAAYLGASNGDAPEFYDLFVAAMEQIAIADCRQIPSRPSPEDLEFLAGADLILLAGGSVEQGWRAFKEAGLDQKLVERYYGGALLIGISAGAVQLGLKGWDDAGEKTLDMLRIVPFVVDAHDEPGWGRLQQAVRKAGEHGRGLGVPSGGGALYHPDYSIEPVRQAVVEVHLTEEGSSQALLLPGEHSDPAGGPRPEADAPEAAKRPAETAGTGGTGGNGGEGGRAGGEGGAGEPAAPAPGTAGAAAERAELGYSIRPDGIIELHRPGGKDEPVN
jgi:hypothetical protein